MKQKSKKRRGFTLIELVVVIIILGILGAIAIPRLTNVTDTATKAANEATAKRIVSQINIASVNHNGDVSKVTADEVNDGLENITAELTDTPAADKWTFSVTGGNIKVFFGTDQFYPAP